MSFIGNQPLYQAFVTDQFSGNGSTTAFTMSVAPANPASVLVAVSGVLQDPSTYSVSGNTLTFSQAPPLGSANISTRYLGIPASGVTTTAYRTITDFTATAGQTVFTPPSYTVGFLNVYQNGVRLGMADYVATNGTTVTLLVAASLNDLITTESFFVSSVLNALPQTGGSILGSLGVSGLATFSGGLVAPGGISNTAIGATTLNVTGNTLLNQSYDQGTGVLQVTGQSTFNGAVTDKSLNLQGGNNLLRYSGAFSNSAWALQSNVTVVDNNAVAPDGTTTAATLTWTTATTATGIFQYTLVNVTNSANTKSVWIKADTAGGTIKLLDPIETVGVTTYTLTTSWALVTLTDVAGSQPTNAGLWIQKTATSPNYIYIWHPQLELGTQASAYTPTTTAAITTTNNISVPSGQVLASSSTSRTLPAISFLGNTAYGFNVNTANGGIDINPSGDTYYSATSTGNLGFNIGYSFPLSWGANRGGLAQDLSLYRDAANTLAQRNTTNAQTFRLYNTYTSSTSYENLQLDWTSTSNVATIGTQVGSGGGTARPLAFSTNATERMRILPTGEVGIGTTSPDRKLMISANNSTNGDLIHLQNSAGTVNPNWYIGIGYPGSYDGYFRIGRTSSGVDFYIDSSGAPTTSNSWYVLGNGGLISTNNGNTFVALNSGAFLGLGALNTVRFYISSVEKMRLHSSGGFSIGNTTDRGAGNLNVSGVVITGGYTVATLPTGVVGMRAYVTDALAPSYSATAVGGGAVTIPVFYNGTAWICA